MKPEKNMSKSRKRKRAADDDYDIKDIEESKEFKSLEEKFNSIMGRNLIPLKSLLRCVSKMTMERL